MTVYDICIEGVEDGLSQEAVQYMVEDMFPYAENVEIVEVPTSD